MYVGQLSPCSAIFLLQFGTFEHTRQLIKRIIPDQNAATFPSEIYNLLDQLLSGPYADFFKGGLYL